MDQYGNYLGILKWSLAQTDGTKPSNVKPLSPEDQEFFEKAMAEASISDGQRMQKILDAMSDPDITDETLETLLEDLEMFLENLDNARDFGNMGGYTKIISVLNTSNIESIKIACLSLLGIAAQNQPDVQKILIETSLLQDLLKQIQSTTNNKLKTKMMGCVCSVVCGFAPAEQTFLFSNGLAVLKEILFKSSSEVQLIRKCLFLLIMLSHTQIMYLRKFLSSELVHILTSRYIVHDDIDVKESSLSLLSIILSLDRTSFTKEEVLPDIQAVLQTIIAYSIQTDTPEEIKSAIAGILRYVQ